MVVNEHPLSPVLIDHPNFNPPVKNIRFSEFLNTIYEPVYDENGKSPFYIEICKLVKRKYNSQGYMAAESYKNCISNFDRITARVRLFNSDSCTFFTVCPRDRKIVDAESGRVLRTSRSDVSVATVCWLDIDLDLLSKNPVEADKIAVQRISQLKPFPNIVVKTPGGYHLYFLLDDMYPVEDVSYTNRRMQKWTGADSCSDPVRIMRIPMGWHRKNPADPQRVKIIHFDDSMRFTLEDFDHYPEVDYTEIEYARKVILPNSVEPIDIEALKDTFSDAKLYRKIMARGMDAYRSIFDENSPGRRCPSRSERDFHIVCQLLKDDIPESKIKAIFLRYSCGDKYREKERHADGYLSYQIESARYRIEETKRFIDGFGMKNAEVGTVYL